jgi:hypothetical protein
MPLNYQSAATKVLKATPLGGAFTVGETIGKTIASGVHKGLQAVGLEESPESIATQHAIFWGQKAKLGDVLRMQRLIQTAFGGIGENKYARARDRALHLIQSLAGVAPWHPQLKDQVVVPAAIVQMANDALRGRQSWPSPTPAPAAGSPSGPTTPSPWESPAPAAPSPSAPKAPRPCKYGRNPETNRCYTKSERARLDRASSPGYGIGGGMAPSVKTYRRFFYGPGPAYQRVSLSWDRVNVPAGYFKTKTEAKAMYMREHPVQANAPKLARPIEKFVGASLSAGAAAAKAAGISLAQILEWTGVGAAGLAAGYALGSLVNWLDARSDPNEKIDVINRAYFTTKNEAMLKKGAPLTGAEVRALRAPFEAEVQKQNRILEQYYSTAGGQNPWEQ